MVTQVLVYWAIGIAVILEMIAIYHVIRREISDGGHFFIGLGQLAALMFVFVRYAALWYDKNASPEITADGFIAMTMVFGGVSLIIALYVVKRTLYSLLQRYF